MKMKCQFLQDKFLSVKFFFKNVFMILKHPISITLYHLVKFGDKTQLIQKIFREFKVFIELKKVIRNKECGLLWITV